MTTNRQIRRDRATCRKPCVDLSEWQAAYCTDRTSQPFGNANGTRTNGIHFANKSRTTRKFCRIVSGHPALQISQRNGSILVARSTACPAVLRGNLIRGPCNIDNRDSRRGLDSPAWRGTEPLRVFSVNPRCGGFSGTPSRSGQRLQPVLHAEQVRTVRRRISQAASRSASNTVRGGIRPITSPPRPHSQVIRPC